MKIKNILVPVDFSDSSDFSMAFAVKLAQEYDAELHLVHVYDEVFTPTDGGFSSAPIPDIPPIDMEEERARLDMVIPPKAVRFRRQFLVGDPADMLVRYADENEADLVVMGTHGRTGLRRLVMGSVAEAVVRRAHCPVITVKQPVQQLQS